MKDDSPFVFTRMPVILPEEHHDSWLSGAENRWLMGSHPAGRNPVTWAQTAVKTPG
jgi:putative SOS response-associated peptidase YedK